MKHLPIPADFPVHPLQPGDKAIREMTCVYCGLSWDDEIPTTYTPAPSGRCPFEYFHKEEESQVVDSNRHKFDKRDANLLRVRTKRLKHGKHAGKYACCVGVPTDHTGERAYSIERIEPFDSRKEAREHGIKVINELLKNEVPTRFASAVMGSGNIRQPFEARCAKCYKHIFFDLDPSGTPGHNGEWGDGEGDYGCPVDSGENSEDGNGHVPEMIRYNRKLYPAG